jgi:putative CocE/NonD family hydrolase
MDLPTLLVTGNFDPSTGALALWRGLESNAAGAQRRHLLIGPWDHNECYIGGGTQRGTYNFGEVALLNVVALRIAFFDRHLKQQDAKPDLNNRVTVFITGANEWRGYDRFPPAEVAPRSLYLASGGHANSSRGDGALVGVAPARAQPPDRFVDDPEWPFIGGMTHAKGPAFAMDLRERERDHDTLVYSTGPLPEAITVLGEPEVELFTTADVPDADLCVWLAEHRPDGSTTFLAMGHQRLRYHAGFDAERPIEPGQVVRVCFTLTYVGHRIAAGHQLRLLVSGSNFPLVDPSPHTAGSVATATAMRQALQTVFHDETRPSRLIVPVSL